MQDLGCGPQTAIWGLDSQTLSPYLRSKPQALVQNLGSDPKPQFGAWTPRFSTFNQDSSKFSLDPKPQFRDEILKPQEPKR